MWLQCVRRPCTPGLPVQKASGRHICADARKGVWLDGLACAVRLRGFEPRARARSCWRWACTRRPRPSWSSRPRWRWARARARPSRSVRTRLSQPAVACPRAIATAQRLSSPCSLPLGSAAGRDGAPLAVCQARLADARGAATPGRRRAPAQGILTACPVDPDSWRAPRRHAAASRGHRAGALPQRRPVGGARGAIGGGRRGRGGRRRGRGRRGRGGRRAGRGRP
jgi:hypothetical protein